MFRTGFPPLPKHHGQLRLGFQPVDEGLQHSLALDYECSLRVPRLGVGWLALALVRRSRWLGVFRCLGCLRRRLVGRRLGIFLRGVGGGALASLCLLLVGIAPAASFGLRRNLRRGDARPRYPSTPATTSCVSSSSLPTVSLCARLSLDPNFNWVFFQQVVAAMRDGVLKELKMKLELQEFLRREHNRCLVSKLAEDAFQRLKRRKGEHFNRRVQAPFSLSPLLQNAPNQFMHVCFHKLAWHVVSFSLNHCLIRGLARARHLVWAGVAVTRSSLRLASFRARAPWGASDPTG